MKKLKNYLTKYQTLIFKMKVLETKINHTLS